MRAVVVACLIIAAGLVPGTAHAAACLTISANKTLTSDIGPDCADNGVVITKGGITLNLAGHTIDGDNDASGVGVLVQGKSGVTIKGPGTIKEFGTGIRVENASHTQIKNLTVQDNKATSTGIVVTQLVKVPCRNFGDPGKKPYCDVTKSSKGTVISGNTVTGNTGSGIVVHRSSSGTKVTGNTVTSNGGDGVFLGGAGSDLIEGETEPGDEVIVKVNKSKIANNTVTDNAGTGIAITAGGSERDNNNRNNCRKNTCDDLPLGGNGNVISGNHSDDNGTRLVSGGGPGHEGGGNREESDNGGHGIKVTGNFRNTKITANETNGNGTPVAATICSQRNGAGILVAGMHKGVLIADNTATDNAMAGIFVAGGDTELGENQGIKILRNTVTANIQNCEGDDMGGVKVTGVARGTKKRPYQILGNTIEDNLGSGVVLAGHNKSFKIGGNTIQNNTGPSSSGSDHKPNDTAGIDIHGRTLNATITGNTASSNTNTSSPCTDPMALNAQRSPAGDCLGNGITIRGSARNILIEGNTTNTNEGVGIGVYVQDSKPCKAVNGGGNCTSFLPDPAPEKNDRSAPGRTPPGPGCPIDIVSGDCKDANFNQPINTRVIGNTANGNGIDGINLVADVTVKNNTADNNADDGIEHNPDATVRGGDASDGPHVISDSGNSVSGNGDAGCVGLANC